MKHKGSRQRVALVAIVALGAIMVQAYGDTQLRIWNDAPRFKCPFQQSEAFSAIGFTGEIWSGGKADTFYPSWGKDGHLYSSFTDGSVDGLYVSSRANKDGESLVAHLTIKGDSPHELEFSDHSVITHNCKPYRGRYPSANLVYDNNWYIGTYALDDLFASNYGTLGPFVGFHVSKDLGKTWTLSPHSPEKPLFGESGKQGGSVKIGAPHFVDFGQNMEHSPDGMAYLVAHGSSLPDRQPRHANNSWITGDQVYLCRVSPNPDKINDASAYEFFAGKDKQGNALWSKIFSSIKPIAEWNNNMGCVTITYILESDHLTGPWSMLAYMKDFGEMAYFVNIPSKFISPDGKTMWLCYSANWVNVWQKREVYPYDPKGSDYSMTLTGRLS